jgi:hypothetical protein
VRVETHHDTGRLEGRLVELLAALKAAEGPFAPALVIAPTRRLLIHLQERLARALPGLLGVRFQHHDALAAAIADDAGLPPLRPIGDAARQAILADRLARAGGPLAEYVADVPGGAASILATLDELREACVDPVAARQVRGLSEAARSILALYAEYAVALDRLAGAGFTDRAGRIAAIAGRGARYAERFRLVVHYGAYDLVGMNLELLRGLTAGDDAPPLVFLAPGHPTAPAFAWARGFWKETLGIDPAPVPEPSAAPGPEAARVLGDALPLLYDESARAAPCAAVSFFNTQGSADELEEAILACIADPHRAPAPGSIAILARSLDPYATALAPAARRHGVPLTTSASLPLSRESASLAATRLFRCLLLDLPAGALFDLIRSGRLRPFDGRDPAGEVDAWERLTREWQVAGGRENLAERLPGWIEAAEPILPDQADDEAIERSARRKRALLALARRLRDLVLALEREARPLRAARDGRAFAEAARRVLAARLIGFEDARSPGAAADPAVEAILAALDDFEALAAAGVRFETPAATLQRLEQGIGALTLPVGALGSDGARVGEDAGGLRVLDLMQARGMAFDTVALVGLNAGLLPRPARVDPFLPDADRALLRSRLGRPIAIKEEGLAEEHLLLALALGSARRRLHVSWQRADDDGRARAPSLALREIGRVARGAPEIDPLVSESRRISADPLARARAAIAAHAMLPAATTAPALAILFGAPERFRLAGAAAALAAIGGEAMRPALDAGLAYLAAIDSREVTPFDALPGGAAPAGPWSPSRLETFGACPQQYFFRHRLRIEEWSDPEAADAIDRRDLGTLAHAVLAAHYRASPPGAADETVAAIAAHLARLWRERAGPLAARLDALYPGLFAIESDAWVASLARFVARDRAMLRQRRGPLEVERPIAATITLPGFGDLSLRGRVDRSLRDADGILVGDYKTGGTPENLVNRRTLLRGERLQMALYALLAESEAGTGKAAVEVLGVGPRFDDEEEEACARLGAKEFGAIRDGLLESLAVLARLAAANRFPLSPRQGLCEYCPYTRACRRAHPATVERLQADPGLADFHRMRRKSLRKPRLADVPVDAGDEEDA